ncbi:HAD family phosphatase [Dyella sp.]|jgi:HAD superfamily hydrolase (TIGR01509 family)|uniref:HAD family hydrolase n=1 Tax=Dyella sp. TaxID=1869338 RepID=UPI002D770574|nr:HAD family phosphatase [Dyella sp.]HET6433302.1 HAD family phosphatase [Dyella sp.]
MSHVPASLDLLIFDCDGVLVDSERITNRVFAQMLGELGLQVSEQYMTEQFYGRTAAESVRRAEQLLGRPLPDEFEAHYGERSRAALASEVTLMPGVADMLERVETPCAIASNGLRVKMEITLRATGLLPRFEGRWFCIDDVVHGKPAPDIYLHTARACGARPGHCVVVEDSPTGIAAGVAAGMTVLGYAAHLPAERLLEAGAQQAFDDMAGLPALLAALRQTRADAASADTR